MLPCVSFKINTNYVVCVVDTKNTNNGEVQKTMKSILLMSQGIKFRTIAHTHSTNNLINGVQTLDSLHFRFDTILSIIVYTENKTKKKQQK